MTAYDINKKLLRLYGREKKTDQPKYRVVRSETQVEKRSGSYNVFTENGIFLRSEVGTREIKKYYYLPNCWILERVEPNTDRQAVIPHKWVYEPIFTFLDRENKPLPLEWKPIEFLLSRLEYMERNKVRTTMTDQDWKDLEEKHLKKREEEMYGILDAPDPIKELPSFSSSSLLNDTKKLLKEEKKNDLHAGIISTV